EASRPRLAAASREALAAARRTDLVRARPRRAADSRRRGPRYPRRRCPRPPTRARLGQAPDARAQGEAGVGTRIDWRVSRLEREEHRQPIAETRDVGGARIGAEPVERALV